MQGCVTIVTGGGRGIGRAICQCFAAEGATVVAAARTASELHETKRLIGDTGGLCHYKAVDISKAEAVRSLIDEAAQRFGRIDVLVNCAGVAPRADIEALDPRLFEAILAVNMRAVYYACRAVWPVMRGQNGGTIVNISSVASVDPFAGFAAYGASKAWVNLWTKALAQEGKAVGIRVYAVAPGAVETRMLRSAFPDFPAESTLQPDDIANVVLALARPDNAYELGQTVFVTKE